MTHGAFFAPMDEQLPEAFTKLELRFHLPDGMRCSVMGEVIQQVPGRGVTIGFNPKDPALDAMQQAVRRNSYQQRAMAEAVPSAEPIIGFTERVQTIRTQIDPRARSELRARVVDLMKSTGPDHQG